MKRTILLLPILTAFHAKAQSIEPAALNATGGQNVIAGNTYEWSVGEMALVNTATTSGLIVTNGVLQPSASTSGVDDFPFRNDQMTVYPNPTDKEVFIQPNLSPQTPMQMVLMDITGKTLLQSETILNSGNEKQSIHLSTYPAGSYMLIIRATDQENNHQASYKIQKN